MSERRVVGAEFADEDESANLLGNVGDDEITTEPNSDFLEAGYFEDIGAERREVGAEFADEEAIELNSDFLDAGYFEDVGAERRVVGAEFADEDESANLLDNDDDAVAVDDSEIAVEPNVPGYLQDVGVPMPAKFVAEGDMFPEPRTAENAVGNYDDEVDEGKLPLSDDHSVPLDTSSLSSLTKTEAKEVFASLNELDGFDDVPAARARDRKRISWVDQENNGPLCRCAVSYILPHAAHHSPLLNTSDGTGRVSTSNVATFRNPGNSRAEVVGTATHRPSVMTQEIINSDMSRYQLVTIRTMPPVYVNWEKNKGWQEGMVPVSQWHNPAPIPPLTPFRLLHPDRPAFDHTRDHTRDSLREQRLSLALDVSTSFPFLEGLFATIEIPVNSATSCDTHS